MKLLAEVCLGPRSKWLFLEMIAVSDWLSSTSLLFVLTVAPRYCYLYIYNNICFCRSDPNHLYGGKTKLVNGDGPMLNNNKVTPQKDSNKETGGEQTHSNEVKQGQTEDHNKKMRGDLATYNEAKVQRERRLRQRQINCEEQAQVWLKCTQQFHPLEVVFRYLDPQLQVSENSSYLFNFRPNILKILQRRFRSQ